jgi:RimJ/RimL family protein N-acetyltransferase
LRCGANASTFGPASVSCFVGETDVVHHESKSTAMFWIESPRLVLRRMRATDLEMFMAYRNDARIARFQGWEALTKEAAVAFLEEQQSREPFLPGQWLQIAIMLKPTHSLLGDCALKIHFEDPRQATIGITLAHEFHGKGFAIEAATTLLNYAFEELGLHRVQADTDPQNTAAWRLLERLGMRREAHLKQSLWFKGRWTDEYFYAILKPEWLSSRQHVMRQFLAGTST